MQQHCEICKTPLKEDWRDHFARHLVTARQVIDETKSLGLGPGRAASALEWVKICRKRLGSAKGTS